MRQIPLRGKPFSQRQSYLTKNVELKREKFAYGLLRKIGKKSVKNCSAWHVFCIELGHTLDENVRLFSQGLQTLQENSYGTGTWMRCFCRGFAYYVLCPPFRQGFGKRRQPAVCQGVLMKMSQDQASIAVDKFLTRESSY